MTPFGEFLIENQSVVAPIIEWGGAVLLFVLVISPFIIIRHHLFKPTRWWTIIGAYITSFVVYVGSFWLISLIDQWLIFNYFNSVELYGAYEGATLKQGLWLFLAWPLLIFYSTKMMYGHFTKKRFWVSVLAMMLFTATLWPIAFYMMLYIFGTISANF